MSAGIESVESVPHPQRGRYGRPGPARCERPLGGREGTMATYVVFHEVDDVDHWLKSPKRDELFGPTGITHRTFYDPQGSKRVGLIFEIPDMEAFQELMQSDAAAEAMKYDGVHPDTILILQER
jgi:hypothetical protein